LAFEVTCTLILRYLNTAPHHSAADHGYLTQPVDNQETIRNCKRCHNEGALLSWLAKPVGRARVR
jgi:hypothetical protein